MDKPVRDYTKDTVQTVVEDVVGVFEDGVIDEKEAKRLIRCLVDVIMTFLNCIYKNLFCISKQ